MFDHFLEDMGEKPDSALTLDRIESAKGYTPGNCRWATQKQQQRNRRNNKMVKIGNITKCLAVWADESPFPYNTIRMRLLRGWDPEEAVFGRR